MSGTRLRWSLAVLAMLLVAATPAGAARLAGGRTQAALQRAFFAGGGHRGQAIVSTRVSTVNGSWAIVTSVEPASERGGGSARSVRLHRSYYRLTGAGARPGGPPAAVLADLARTFSIGVEYSGAGAESIAYAQTYRGMCRGAGTFTETEDDTVSPMSWTVRYVVDLDDVLSATRGPGGVTIVPAISFSPGDSTIDAQETDAQTLVDTSCNEHPTTDTCRAHFSPGGAGLLSFPGQGLEVGVPAVEHGTGDCDPTSFTLGPSLWDQGATTAVVARLGLAGGSLPGDPYAPVRVSWPRDSAGAGLVTSPCQSLSTACHESFRWRGRVRLVPAAG